MTETYKPLFAEFLGTAILVFVGCGSVALGDYGQNMPMGILPIALAFGGVLIGLIYALGPISGCHINPAVTVAAWIAGRFEAKKIAGYVVAQTLGAVLASALLVVLLSSTVSSAPQEVLNLGQNGWGAGYLGEYNTMAAFIVEFSVTFLFVLVILGATGSQANTPFAGIAIGMTLLVCLITFVNVTGCSLNPARSIGPALFAGGAAMGQLWLFILAPILGGALAGLVFRSGILEHDSAAPQVA